MTGDSEPVSLGDLLATASSRKGHTREDAPAFELTALIARRYGCTFDELAKEIEGPGRLAAVARDLLNWPAPERRPRGRPRDDDAAWRLYLYVGARMRDGVSAAGAIAELVERGGGENPDATTAETLQRRYSRAVGRWGEPDRPIILSDFFSSPPDPR